MISERLLIELDSYLRKHCYYVYDYFLDPLKEQEIDEYLQKMNITDPDYKIFYTWKNGVDFFAPYLPSTYRIMAHGNFVPLSGALEMYKNNGEDYVFWEQSKILIANSLEGEKLLLETDENSDYVGFVFSCVPYGNFAGEPIPIYDSLGQMINSLIAMYKDRAMVYDVESNHLDIDFDIVAAACIPLNPRSIYWKDY